MRVQFCIVVSRGQSCSITVNCSKYEMVFKEPGTRKCIHHPIHPSKTDVCPLYCPLHSLLHLPLSLIFQLSPTDKTMDFQKHFRIHHYAGDVTWVAHTVSQFVGWPSPVWAQAVAEKSEWILCGVFKCKLYNPVHGESLYDFGSTALVHGGTACCQCLQ